MDKPKKKLPQNLKEILKDIGENAVLFYIFTHTHSTKWKAYKNLEEEGCDIILLNLTNKKSINIEVKTRQGIYSTSKYLNSKIFVVSELEKRSMDFLICYWFEHHTFFIVPKKDIGSKNRLWVRKNKKGDYGVNQKYANNWKPLIDKMK